MSPVTDAVVLAAGRSSRMAPRNKLLLTGADGRRLIAHTVEAVRAGGVRDILVVLGHQHDAVAAALPAVARAVICADWALGLAHSLHAGLAALRGDTGAVLVCLGDMPAVRPDSIAALRDAWRPGAIVAPRHGGQRGNPVLWDRAHLPRLLALAGDHGARAWLAERPQALIEVDVRDEGVLRDADTPRAARALAGGPWV